MEKEIIKINTEFIKLNAFLKFCGEAESGADANFMIENGEISVNNETQTSKRKKLYDGYEIKAGGKIYIIKTEKSGD